MTRAVAAAKTILVAGGAGGVGEGIVRALLAAGHTAIVPSRSPAKLELLRERLGETTIARGRLETFEGHVGEIEGAEAIRDRIAREFGRIDVAIASLGGWWEGQKLTEISIEVWDANINEMLRPHFVFARVFVPMLQAQAGGGLYLGIGGGAAYFPIPLAAPISIAAAAQVMLTRALCAELDDPQVEILELVVDGPVRTRDSLGIAEPWWIDADEVGDVVAELVARGRVRGPAIHASGPIVRMRPKDRPVPRRRDYASPRWEGH